MNELVKKVDGKVSVSSKDIADKFEKIHRHVLRDIEKIDCSQEFRESNFGLSSYTSLQNKVLPCYYLTRDGFAFLCMGFTGKKAAEWKEKYIAAFNSMEAEILNPISAMEALNELSKKIDSDKKIASFCGRELSNYKKIKKDNQDNFKLEFEKVQLSFGFKLTNKE